MPVQFNSYSRTVNGAARTTPMSTLINQFQWGFYWQADQRLYAVKKDSQESDGSIVTTVTKRGLYMINAAAATTPQNCIVPYYFHTGFVHRGLLSQRPEDMMGIVGSYCFYSQDFNRFLKTQNEALVNDYTSARNATVPNGPVTVPANAYGRGVPSRATTYWEYRPSLTYTGQYEAFYSVQVNKWAIIKPYAQFIVNPAGNGTVGNEWIMGFRTQLIF
jgi:carbohydrate-selective porin OprB